MGRRTAAWRPSGRLSTIVRRPLGEASAAFDTPFDRFHNPRDVKRAKRRSAPGAFTCL